MKKVTENRKLNREAVNTGDLRPGINKTKTKKISLIADTALSCGCDVIQLLEEKKGNVCLSVPAMYGDIKNICVHI